MMLRPFIWIHSEPQGSASARRKGCRESATENKKAPLTKGQKGWNPRLEGAEEETIRKLSEGSPRGVGPRGAGVTQTSASTQRNA